MNKIDWSQVYVASSQRDLLTAEDVEFLRSQCGKLPEGYEAFVTTFGAGDLCEIQVLNRKQIDCGITYLRDKLTEWFLSAQDEDVPPIIPEQFALDAVPLAATVWGDDYFCSPSEPGVLWRIPTTWDWYHSPARLPLGFTNPFVRQVPGEEPDCIAPRHLLFEPSVGRTFRVVQLVPGEKTPVGVEDLRTLIQTLIAADLDASDEHSLVLYVQRWGARFGAGPRQHKSGYIFSCFMENEYLPEFDRLVQAICSYGYLIAAQ